MSWTHCGLMFPAATCTSLFPVIINLTVFTCVWSACSAKLHFVALYFVKYTLSLCPWCYQACLSDPDHVVLLTFIFLAFCLVYFDLFVLCLFDVDFGFVRWDCSYFCELFLINWPALASTLQSVFLKTSSLRCWWMTPVLTPPRSCGITESYFISQVITWWLFIFYSQHDKHYYLSLILTRQALVISL